MSSFNSTHLTKLLWNLDMTQERITSVSKYIGNHQDHVSECVSIWEEQLNKCHNERKLLFMYVLNDVIQVYRGSNASVAFISVYDLNYYYIKRLDSVLYAVVRDCPSLFSKIKRLISVWKERSVISNNKLIEYNEIIQNAIDDHNNGIDRRVYQSISDLDDSEDPEESEQEQEQHFSLSDQSDNEDLSNNQEIGDIAGEKNQRVIHHLLVNGSHLAESEETVDSARCELVDCPDWVLSENAFSQSLAEIMENKDHSHTVLEDGKRLASTIMRSLEYSMRARDSIIQHLNSLSDMKRRRVEKLEEMIRDSEEVLNMLQTVDSGEEDRIVRTIRRPCMSNTNSLDLSKEALQSITKSIKEAEHEEEQREREKQEREKHEADIRDSINHSIIKTSAEDLMGKAWNARSLFERIMYGCL